MDADAFQQPLAQTTIGEIAATLLGATSVLRDLKIDYTGNLDASLFDAAARSGVELRDAIDRLEALDAIPTDTVPRATKDLIEYILESYHAKHRRELPILFQLARKVEEAHRGHPAQPQGLADVISALMNDLDSHMKKEESVLFPLLEQGVNLRVAYPIAMMMREHDIHSQVLGHLDKLTNGFNPPVHACRTWQALYDGLVTLTDDLIRHIHIENKSLFPRFTVHTREIAASVPSSGA